MVVYSQIRTSDDVLQSTIRLSALTPFLQQQQATACAIVNTTLHGLLPFAQACQQAGVHAVFGLEVVVQFADDSEAPLIFYAMNEQGYRNLLKITSAVETQQGYLKWTWLKSYHHGCLLAHHSTENHLQQLAALAPDTLYTSIPNTQGIPVILHYPVRYLYPQQAYSYTVARKLAGEDVTVEQVQRLCAYTKGMWQDFDQQVCATTAAMLMRCQVSIPTGNYLPRYSDVDDANVALAQMAQQSLCKRLQVTSLPPSYAERLAYELDVIRKMGFSDYFLIVADFMRYAREQNILTGPGRGSSASSLVAYALAITQVDPLQYGLLFERFLNYARQTLPDIDIDFVDSRRQAVIQYVAEKYGRAHVAQISTTGTLAMRAAAREVARAMSFEGPVLEQIASLLPQRESTLQQAYDASPNLRQFVAQSEKHQLWWRTACELEGLPRNRSIHAAGIVLSPKPLVELVPIEQGNDQLFATQWPMQEVEAVGLLKIDFLGLRNLTILAQIRWLYYQQYKQWLDLTQLPLDDEATFALLQSGDTTGIFQLESLGMREALRVIEPTRFLDIVAVSALYRPGPMAFIPVYAKRKKGQEEVEMPHPDLAPILKETYGVIVYQEQILQIATTFAGMTLGEADILRRAISKKDGAKLQQERVHFIEGALRKGYDETTAITIFDMIVRFANYGFVKSHAVAYSLISYQLAYMKANFPALFFAALLTNSMGDQQKTQPILREAQQRKIKIMPPDCNKSERYYTTANEQIIVGLSAIKRVPKQFIKTLLGVRKQYGAFTSIFDLAMKLSAEHFNEKAIHQLILAGALDSLNECRAQLIASLPAARAHVKMHRKTADIPLEEAQAVVFGTPKHEQANPLSLREKLAGEKEALGFYISEHPVTSYRKEHLTSLQVKQAVGARVVWLGIIEQVKVLRTKKGEQMAFIEVEDEFNALSVTIFPSLYRQVAPLLIEETLIQIDGIVEQWNGKTQIQAKSLNVL